MSVPARGEKDNGKSTDSFRLVSLDILSKIDQRAGIPSPMLPVALLLQDGRRKPMSMSTRS